MCVSRSCQLEDVCLEVATVSARRGAPGDIVKNRARFVAGFTRW
jgi:hypothetical protein